MGTDNNPKKIFIAKFLMDKEKQYFKSFLPETQINFAWSYADMLCLNLDLVVDNLEVQLDVKLIK